MGKPYRVLVLNSGGYDSTVLLYYFKQMGYDIGSLSFDYGQPLEELEYAEYNANKLKIPMDDQFKLKIDMSWATKSIYNGKRAGDVGYIPMRNSIFLSYALSLSEVYEFDAVGIGVLCSGTFADNNAYFVDDFQPIAGKIDKWIMSPLDQMEKWQVYELGEKLGVNVNLTWSCNTPIKKDGEVLRCGLCNSCVCLKEAMSKKIINNKDIVFAV